MYFETGGLSNAFRIYSLFLSIPAISVLRTLDHIQCRINAAIALTVVLTEKEYCDSFKCLIILKKHKGGLGVYRLDL